MPSIDRWTSRGRSRSAWPRELRRAALFHRRLLSAGLAALAVALTIAALEPPRPPTIEVLTAARDIIGGAVITADDLTTVALPPTVVPDGALGQAQLAVGRVSAGPVRRGEPITDVRLVGPSLVAGFGDGVVATPVRVQDAAALALLRPGDRIDVLATPASSDGVGGSVRVVAADVAVVAIPTGSAAGAYDEGGLLLVATSSGQASALAEASATARLSIVILAG